MKILHTADWHLGKMLEAHSRLEEQSQVLEQICTIADEQQVDAIIVAGDIFDTFNPSIEASELLFRTLYRLSHNGTRAVIAIAGNHDSPDRIDMPDALARVCGILFTGAPIPTIQPIQTVGGISTLQTDKGFVELKLPNSPYPLRLILTPFCNELRLKKYLGNEDKEASMRSLLATHWAALADKYCDDKGVNILVSHLYMMQEGGTPPQEPEDGEKLIMVGGAQAIYTQQIPPQIQYTALGHLHRYQNVGAGNQLVVYSGSPLAYSFAEANQPKYVAILHATPNAPIEIEKISLLEGKKLLRQRFESIDEAIVWLENHQDAWVQVTIATEKYLSSAETNRLRQAHKGIVYIIPELIGNTTSNQSSAAINIAEQSIETLFEQFFTHKKGTPPNDELKSLFTEILHTPLGEGE